MHIHASIKSCRNTFSLIQDSTVRPRPAKRSHNLPARIVVAKELAEIFKVVAHPDRIRLVEELSQGEVDVNGLAERLDLSAPRVSQHLNQLRVHRLVEERRNGRRHFYTLRQPEIAAWILSALDFVEGRGTTIPKTKLNTARRLWSGGSEPTTTSSGAHATKHT